MYRQYETIIPKKAKKVPCVNVKSKSVNVISLMYNMDVLLTFVVA